MWRPHQHRALWPWRPWGQVSGAGRGVVALWDLLRGGAKRQGTMVGVGTGGASWGLVVGWWCSAGPAQWGVGAGVGEVLWWGLDLAGRHGRGVGASGVSWALWWHVGACTVGRWGAGDVHVHVWGCSCSGQVVSRALERRVGTYRFERWCSIAQPCNVAPTLGLCVLATWVHQGRTLR
jgi:hypothetical protein